MKSLTAVCKKHNLLTDISRSERPKKEKKIGHSEFFVLERKMGSKPGLKEIDFSDGNIRSSLKTE